MADKLDKIMRVSFLALQHDIKYGHLKWKIAPLAREAKVSRGWLYSYFGANKKKILSIAVENAADEFLCLSPAGQAYIKEHGPLAAFDRTQKWVEDYPEVIIFSFKHLRSPCQFGELLRQKETLYIQKFLLNRYNLQNDLQLSLLRSMINGLALSFFHSPEKVKELAKFVLAGPFIEWLRTQK